MIYTLSVRLLPVTATLSAFRTICNHRYLRAECIPLCAYRAGASQFSSQTAQSFTGRVNNIPSRFTVSGLAVKVFIKSLPNKSYTLVNTQTSSIVEVHTTKSANLPLRIAYASTQKVLGKKFLVTWGRRIIEKSGSKIDPFCDLWQVLTRQMLALQILFACISCRRDRQRWNSNFSRSP